MWRGKGLVLSRVGGVKMWNSKQDFISALLFWLSLMLLLFLFFFLFPFAVRGDGEFSVGFATTDFVNFTVNNESLLVTADDLSYNYTVPASPATLTVSIPVIFNESLNLFNISIDNPDVQCDFNETLANQTAYLEWVIREQLVPSQEQYHGLEIDRD